jgi:hypothetical protein
MPSVTPTSPRRTASGRSAITNRPSRRLNGNSPVGRRVRDLFHGLMERLDNPVDVVTVADVLALAELKTAAEVARVRMLEGGGDRGSNECVRLENLVRRAEARIGLAAGSTKADPETLEEYLARTDPDQGEIDDLADNEETP